MKSFWSSKKTTKESAHRPAARMKLARRRRLRLSRGTASRLQRLIRRTGELAALGAEGEALKRLRGDVRRIAACLYSARAGEGARLPANANVRVLELARRMVNGGENRLSREKICAGIRDFDEKQRLEMGEIQCMPAALRIALCEAMALTAEEILRDAGACLHARRWVERGGRLPRRCSAAFLAYAQRLAFEEERPEIHAFLENFNLAAAEEQLRRQDADCSLRMDNLMQLYFLLESLDWQRCFEQLSPVEEELRTDTIYPNMDADSRAELRSCLAALARQLDAEEITVARFALRLAREESDTVCRFIMEDAGRARLRSALGAKNAPRRRVPDPSGRLCVGILGGLSALSAGLLCWAMGSPLLWIYSIPLAWMFATKLSGRLYSIWVKPRRLLKMDIERVPADARTLVVLPVLLSSRARAHEMLRRMEELGCLERDENVDFLLLGDFRDADAAELEEDATILSAVRMGVANMNARSEREKYFYLHRERRFREKDGRWMGEGRKRGALTALNRLILNREGAEHAFGAENAAARRIAGAYRYVVTLDADTQYLPGTIQKLVGAMLHPLNEKYAVLQPCMEQTIESCTNAYVELNCGAGGVDGYPASVSDFYQDMTGFGNFSGKGIYDVRAFAAATDGTLPDAEILSHDLIEGILAGAGFLGDLCFYDGAPERFSAEISRLHRWTRGDWQLLRVLFSRMKISALNRMKMLGNLLRSLYAPALLSLLVSALWFDLPGAFIAGLAAAYFDAMLSPLSFRAWKRAALRLALLPAEAARMLDAILRALWRLFVSRKHLLDWVPAADAAKADTLLRVPGRITALLVLPGLLRPFWLPAAAALALLFWVGTDWAEDLAARRTDGAAALLPGQRALLAALAGETWRFFESFVPMDGPGLPPDNVQFDPPAGVAARTSPTNIGLYMLSCICARELGLIDADACKQRLRTTAQTLRALDKWKGQFYNWYDIDSLAPLKPRYVSAVDSGNLAAALLLCAEMAEDEELSASLRLLAAEMHLDALYDPERHLFFIGADVESGRISEAHYDLYASESRLLSYAAMMLGQAPVKHWKHLSRAAVRVGKEQALLSWSGTMFEYLMPEILLRSHPASLAGAGCRAAVAAQLRHGALRNRPWGVSESGHYAFDLHLNYQYRAFGLPELALSPSAEGAVVAPYACALALCCAPGQAADNLLRMRNAGWSGEFGMYEAADYRRSGEDEAPRLVKSCMAHHQGMLLCAICNALREDVLPRRFMQIPQAAALRLLLQEKKAAPVRFPAGREGALPRTAAVRPERSSRRNARTNQAVDVHLLHGAGTTALVSSHGAAHVWQEGVQLSRFSHALRSRREGMYVHLEDAAAGEATVFGMSGRAEFDAGSALFREELRGVHAELRLFISPETGALCQKITLENRSTGDRILAVTGCFSVALAKAGDMRAHPVFQNLFVETRRAGNALFFHRRAREAGGELKDMVYLCSRRAAAETSLEKLVGRRGMTGIPGGIARELSETTGHVLNPCAALRTLVPVKAGGSEELHFVLAADKDCAALLSRIADADAVERALLLSAAHARAAMRQAGVDTPLGRLLQRACVCLFDAKLRPRRQGNVPDEPVQREALWSMGISGENPILLMELGSAGQLACARELLHAHSFFRSQGVMIDLVFLNGEGGYSRPARDALEHMIAASPLSELRAQHGGVFVLDKNLLEEAALSALLRAAALRFDPEDGLSAQLRRQLDALDCPAQAPWQSMEAVRQEQPENLAFFNGYGGFDGDAYVICLRDGVLPPAPWANIIASEGGGAVITARGGGFAWHKNSRSGRLTPFANDALREGWGWMFYLLDEGRRSWMRLLPGDVPMTDFIVRFSPGLCRWQGAASGLRFSVEAWPAQDGVEFSVEIENTGDRAAQWRFAAAVDWLLGVDNLDASLLHSWSGFGACFASGAAGTGLFAADDPRAGSGCELPVLLGRGDLMHPDGFDLLDSGHGGSVLHLPVRLAPGKKKCIRLLLCGAADASAAHARLRSFQTEPAARPQERILRVQTPDAAVNHLFNGFLQAQTKYARILGRTGLYQPGGAYGFRDQLQDMLPLIYTEPGRVRDHLLRCAARQFAGGDVLHWWHEPCTGVRTKIRDDLLFLPYVAAQYVLITGDEDLLREELPYLRDVEIPEGREDVYARMQPSDFSESLHSHCMRAFRRAAETGSHGLCLMGGGDWNDGMNRIGIEGRGESIWLTEFLAACAADYAQVAPNQEDRAWLCALNERLCGAVEQHGWDGGWYLRAFADDGSVQGGKESSCCRIDAISQAWAVLAGLDERRCAAAMDAAWKQLADENYGLIRLLTPPYDGRGFDPGYIAAYPPGVRENGAQYTHGACWLALALVRMGDAERAHRAIEMLLPLNHARTKEQADLYRVEPYVMAADICTSDAHMGRGGWTWYTGSAAWMLMLLYALLGLEKRGNRVRLNALLGDWEQVAITLPFGSAAYTLICRRDAASVSLDGAPVQDDYIEMQDDGRQHSAVFPPRCAREGEAQRRQKITRLTNKEIHRVL